MVDAVAVAESGKGGALAIERGEGLTSDDGFEIGRISAATIFLLVFTAARGVHCQQRCGQRQGSTSNWWRIAALDGP